jgi:predicted transcriptional regulator
MELLEVVAGTPHRRSILRALRGERHDLRGLADTLAVPRTTLRHNLDALSEATLIERTLENEYRLTSTGQAVLDGLDAFRDHVDAASTLAPFLECVSSDDLGVDIDAFADARVTAASKLRPHAPVQRLLDVLEAAESVALATPMLPPDTPRFGEVLAGDTDAEVFVSEEVATLVRSADADWGTDRSMVVIEDDPDFCAGVADGTALLLGLDDRGKPHALVECWDRACCRWLRQRLSAYREGATRASTCSNA